MDLIETAHTGPDKPRPPDPIDLVRPCRCGSCGNIDGTQLAFHGHGVRVRAAVLPGVHWAKPARIVFVATRRFVCTACGATVTVLPRGLLPRCLYSLFAMVHALWLAAPRPVGLGLQDEAVHDQQGVDRLSGEARRDGRRRWRSLARWTASARQWWPSVALVGETWRARAADHAGEAPAAVVRSAVDRHAGHGAAM
jgi:hypothetical protein